MTWFELTQFNSTVLSLLHLLNPGKLFDLVCLTSFQCICILSPPKAIFHSDIAVICSYTTLILITRIVTRKPFAACGLRHVVPLLFPKRIRR